MLGELNAISTSFGTSIFDASSSRESSSLFEIVSSLSLERPRISIRSSSWGTGGSCCTGLVTAGFATVVTAIGVTLSFTTGSILRKSSSPDDDDNDSLAASVELRASAKMSSLFSSNTDIIAPYMSVYVIRVLLLLQMYITYAVYHC